MDTTSTGAPINGVLACKHARQGSALSVNFPLFEGFSHTFKVRNAQAQTDLREAELLETEGRSSANSPMRNSASEPQR